MRVLRILNPNETFVRAETGAVQGRLFAVLNVEISSTGQSGTLLPEHREIVFANSRSGLAGSEIFARIPLVGASEGGQFDTNITASPAAASA
jgi:hypothetical protein